MLSIRCKECGREVSGHPTQARSCGCPNMATVKGDSITAVDLNKVVMLNSGKRMEKDNSLTLKICSGRKNAANVKFVNLILRFDDQP